MAWNYPLLDRIVLGRDRWLSDHPSVDRAIGVAWDTSDPAGRRKLIAALLRRRRPEGLVVLIERLHELDSGSRAELARQIDQLQKPLRTVLSSRSGAAATDAQINALILIEAAAAGSLAYLVTEKLRSPDEAVRRQAEGCLLGLARRAGGMEPVESHRLTEAVNEAVVRFGRHRRPAALRAWLGLAPRGLVAGGPAIEALQDPEHAAVGPMRELLKEAGHEMDRAGLVTALSLSPLTLAAVEGLRRCVENRTWGQAIAGQEHLLDWPKVRQGLARAGELQRLIPEQWADQDEAAVRTLPAWIAALPGSPLEKTVQMGRLTESSAPGSARFEACRRLMTLADEAIHDPHQPADPRLLTEVRRRLTDQLDTDYASLAQLSATWLTRDLARQNDDAADRVLAAMSRSRHDRVKAMASQRLRTTAFDRLWTAWPTLRDAARLQAARSALRIDPLAPQRLEHQLKRGGPSRTRALEIAILMPEPPRRPAAAPLAASDLVNSAGDTE